MAQHKVGNKILSDEEFEVHAYEIWGFWLFVIGAIVTGMAVLEYMPEDWSKNVRYTALIASCGTVGFILAKLAPFIRQMFYVGIALGILAFILDWAWKLV